MEASSHTWYEVMWWHRWNVTYDNAYLEYLTCSTNYLIIIKYLSMLVAEKYYAEVTKKETIANIVLLIIAKHAKNNKVFDYIFENFLKFEFSSKK